MNTKFRLKKEAVPFFKRRYACEVKDFDSWQKLQVDIAALEEVKPPYLTYGHKRNDSTTLLSGWDSEKGSNFHFTLEIPGQNSKEYDLFKEEHNMRKLMEAVEDRIMEFYFTQISEEEQI